MITIMIVFRKPLGSLDAESRASTQNRAFKFVWCRANLAAQVECNMKLTKETTDHRLSAPERPNYLHRWTETQPPMFENLPTRDS